MKFYFVLFSYALLSACSTTKTYHSLNSGFHYVTGNISPNTKIFLIAGSDDSANFNQEIIDQKRIWKARGFTKDEIACYYAPPRDGNNQDTEQFRQLKYEMNDCFLANPGVLMAHLQSLKTSQTTDFYFYFSSHGSRPFRSQSVKEIPDEQKERFFRILKLPEWANPYSLDMVIERDSDTGNLFLNTSHQKIWDYAEANPQGAANYILTPASLRAGLEQLPSSSKKFVVVQGCFSGSFVLAPNTENGPSLRGLAKTTVLTAARHDTTSFGCDPGSTTTLFGGFYAKALEAQTGRSFWDLDWSRIYKEVRENVRRVEKEGKQESSEPQFWSSVD